MGRFKEILQEKHDDIFEEKVLDVENGAKIPDPLTLKIGGESVKFMVNGMKVGGKLYKGWFSYQSPRSSKNGVATVTFYSRESGKLPDVVRKAFTVKNDTDTMTDYFDKDRINFGKEHGEIFKAALIAAARYEYKALEWEKTNIEKIKKKLETDKKYQAGYDNTSKMIKWKLDLIKEIMTLAK